MKKSLDDFFAGNVIDQTKKENNDYNVKRSFKQYIKYLSTLDVDLKIEILKEVINNYEDYFIRGGKNGKNN